MFCLGLIMARPINVIHVAPNRSYPNEPRGCLVPKYGDFMPKIPDGPKQPRPTEPRKSPKSVRKLPRDPIARGIAAVRETTGEDVGDMADEITRAPEKR